ncbi:CRISPR-associated helicase Cas3' [Desulfatitalea alkaliphila]|uniref:CRISPR-associated helicase Cas3 n=1 Tax=Desulfatitalea alkaliphila TaxID=2929485 RepID=A0AA41RE44_9BACT|nr:CRISPR-associated helicase Cas3' [Desulfatitalea alkaliphila]MCJ8503093.1 CRISPR-associated helicase Cas3' [Desulfatitalea alkaliphila]
MAPDLFAHSIPGQPVSAWQPLDVHLRNVAQRAAEFARPFGAHHWAWLAGAHHDVGKGTLVWQAYLRHANAVMDELAMHYNGRIEHAAIGALQLFRYAPEAGKLLAYCVAGHHGGLGNWCGPEDDSLKAKLEQQWPPTHLSMEEKEFPRQLPLAATNGERFGFQIQFFVRMLFSCLVDADFLDTEAAMDPLRAGERSQYPDLPSLHRTFRQHFNALRANAESTLVNVHRETVLSDCLAAAEAPEGLFSLTVPTGGGKTLASLAFALAHALRHNKRRIIYVIPFTSIIEQNAAVFRSMLGEGAVLEHHCQFTIDDADRHTRLAAENWDAPIVVTTNVQFFDSFFARKPSRCRKLHNVADSVVIFDEVQAIPVEKWRPCLEVVRELALNYKVSAVLCTATQPAVHKCDAFPAGLEGVSEIIRDVPALFSALKRTRETFIGDMTVADLASALMTHPQALCVVNTRQQALDLFDALPSEDGHFHLSALMYPAHRSRVFAAIRDRLDKGRPCRVVSTQLIEAGVDVDFACVYRAISGIDSIAQAAGRCNRNGRNATAGPVYVFKPAEASDHGHFRMAAQSARKLFDRYDGDLTTPQCVRDYFDDYFWKNAHRMDADGILEHCNAAYRGEIQFKDIAAFQMIQSATLPIIVALEPEAATLVDQLTFAGPARSLLRKLQPYTVQIYPHQMNELHDWLENPLPGLWVLRSEQRYSARTGIECAPPEGEVFFG